MVNKTTTDLRNAFFSEAVGKVASANDLEYEYYKKALAGELPGGSSVDSPALVLSRHRPSWLTTFQTGHGWTNPLGGGEIAADTSDFIFGSQSMRITNGAIQRSGLALNLTDKILCLWLKVDSLESAGVIYVYAGDSAMANFRAWTVRRGTDSAPWFKNGDWAFVTFPYEASSVTGEPDPATVTTVRVRTVGGGVIKVNAVGTVPRTSLPQYPNGVVSVTFDDAYKSVYPAAKKSMSPRGLAGTVYVIPNLIGNSNFMTESELEELHSIHSWDIEAHALNSVAGRDTDDLRKELASIKTWIKSRGLGRGDHFAYPGGQHDPSAVKVMREFFTTARTIAHPSPETLPPAMPHQLRGLTGIGHTTSVASVKAQIDYAVQGGYWLNLVFHRIVDGPTQDGNDCTWADFDAILDYILSSGVAVRTVDEITREL